MTNNLKYWLFVLIGFLTVLIMYKNSSKFLESFGPFDDPSITGDGNGSPSTGSPSTGGPSTGGSSTGSPSTEPQVNNGADTTLPYSEHVLMYFNSFNVRNDSGIASTNNTYQCDNNTWCDALNRSIKYFINGTNIPLTIDNIGLPMNNIMIQGPPSYSLVSRDNHYKLGSFSVVFYLNFNSITFDSDADIILYEMFAESPNRVKIALIEIPNNTEDLELSITLGPADQAYTWKIPRSTFESNGNTTLYSLVYNERDKTITFYIGTSANINVADIQGTPRIILGVTPLEINKNRNLDALLSAFCYYDVVLTRLDLERIKKFFENQSKSVNTLQNTLLSLKSSLTSQNTSLLHQLNTSSETIQGLERRLEDLSNKTCVVQSPAPMARGRNWHINMDNVSSVNDKDLQQCSPLTLKEFDIKIPQLLIPNIEQTANLANNLTGNTGSGGPSASGGSSGAGVASGTGVASGSSASGGPSGQNTIYGNLNQAAQQQGTLTSG